MATTAVTSGIANYYDTGQNNSSSLYGWREGGDYGILGDPNNNDPPATGPYVAYPSYYAEQPVSKIAQSGGQVVSASSSTSSESVYAVKEANGHLDLLVINKSSSASLTDQFDISGFQPNGQAQLWQYGETQDMAQSQTGNGASSLANSTTTLSLSGSNFSYTFPAYSMTVIDLKPRATATTTAVTSSNASAGYGQSVTFTATVTPSSGSGETGSVQFQIDGGNVAGPATLSGNTATYNTSTLAAGSHSIVAIYSGDVNFTGSTSATFTQNIVPAWLSATSVATWNTGTQTLTVTGNATFIANPSTFSVVPIINASGNTSKLVVNTATANLGSLSLTSGAT